MRSMYKSEEGSRRRRKAECGLRCASIQGEESSPTLGKETASVFFLKKCTFAIPVMNLVDDINHTGNEMFTNLVQGPVFGGGGGVERVYYERCSMTGGMIRGVQ